jgi:hypothetical protein
VALQATLTATGASAELPMATLSSVRPLPTAPVAGGSLILGYAVAVSSGSRPLGGVVLLLGGIWCIRVWTLRCGARTAASLAAVAFAAFVLSHLLALAIGAWPSVLIAAAVTATVVWMRADVQPTSSSTGLAFRRPAG